MRTDFRTVEGGVQYRVITVARAVKLIADVEVYLWWSEASIEFIKGDHFLVIQVQFNHQSVEL